jgi:hypothetical protein
MYLLVYTLLSSNTPAITNVPNTDTIDSPVLKANATKSPMIIAEHNKASDIIIIDNIKINSPFICGKFKKGIPIKIRPSVSEFC